MNEPVTTPSQGAQFLGGLVAGFGCAFLYFVAAGLLFAVIRVPALSWIVSSCGWIGLIQFVYIAPLVIIARKEGRPDEAKGLLSAAAVILLLNAACWGSY